MYSITDACESGASKVRGASHTVFTGILLDILCGQTTDSPDQLTLGEICRQLRRIMLERGFPVPQQRGTATADLLVLSRATPIGTGPLRPAHQRHMLGPSPQHPCHNALSQKPSKNTSSG